MNRVVVGVDGSRGGEAALHFAAREASLRHATLEVVSAYHVPAAVYAGGFVPPADLISGFHEASEELAQRGAAEIEAEYPDLDIQFRSCLGQPAEVLLQEAEEADLLVVGSRGLGGFKSLLLGSVSHQVAQHATCPVVIVPRPDEDGGA